MGRLIDGQTDRRTDGQTNAQVCELLNYSAPLAQKGPAPEKQQAGGEARRSPVILTGTKFSPKHLSSSLYLLWTICPLSDELKAGWKYAYFI